MNRKQEVAYANRLLCEWQKKLRLQDWDVCLKLCEHEAFGDGKQCMGDIGINFQHRRAEIRLLKPSLRELRDPPLENSLVHELLHILFAPFCHDLHVRSVAQDREEQAINPLANLLTGFSYTDF